MHGFDDVEGMDALAAHVANLLSTESADSMLHKCNNILLFSYRFLYFFFFKNTFQI